MNTKLITGFIALAAIAGLVGGGMIMASASDSETIETELAKSTDEELAGTPKPSHVLGPPDLTAEAVRLIRDQTRPANVEAAGGYLSIARRHGASMAQVKAVVAGIQAELASRAAQEPIE